MAEFHTVCKVEDLSEGEGKTVEVAGKLIAVFCHNGQCSAIDDVCPHMGASLSGGYVENGVVTCPWHACRGVFAWPMGPGPTVHASRSAAIRYGLKTEPCKLRLAAARVNRKSGCSMPPSPSGPAAVALTSRRTITSLSPIGSWARRRGCEIMGNGRRIESAGFPDAVGESVNEQRSRAE